MTDNKLIIIEAKVFAQSKHDKIIINTVSGKSFRHSDHLQEVADLVWASGGSDIEIAAAWLHDIVEDTDTTIDEITSLFGKDIADIVFSLTDSEEIKHLPTEQRKQKQTEHIAHENDSVKRIKLADQIVNVKFLRIDPKVGWKKENGYNYVLGAKKIMDKCKGISPILDNLMEVEYKKAIEILS